MANVKVIIAAHKKYQMPNDSMYLPLHVGAEGKDLELGYAKDNTGDNISIKNKNYCELTGLYWAWKNVNADYIGLAHYRRHFVLKKHSKSNFENVLNSHEVEDLLKTTDIILPKKRNYIIETLYDHYKHTMYVEPLDEVRNVMKELYPEYVAEFDNLKKRRSAHMFNMFIMKKNIFDDYCKWLFDILFELEHRVKDLEYDEFHSRFYGRISELLLDVYLRTNHLQYKEIDFAYMEKICWRRKAMNFAMSKFFNKKYKSSF